jgi:hypothetical protein
MAGGKKREKRLLSIAFFLQPSLTKQRIFPPVFLSRNTP